MGPPLYYRNAIPDLSSSSPLHNMTALSSSPPISPHSPTPQSRTLTRPLDSPSSSNPHPFSGSAKAGIHSHPSFGRDQLRSKHLRGSPEKAAAAGDKTWVLTAGPSSSSRAHASALAASNERQGRLIEDALEQHFFDSSDDNPSSDWNDAMDHTSSTAPTSIQSATSRIGLGIDSSTATDSEMRGTSHATYGLGTAFQEHTPIPFTLPRKAKVRTFSRTQSSSQDPFSAGAGTSHTPGDQSPRSQRQTQRRRLTGSSPKKLTRSRFDKAPSDNSSDEGLAPWEEMQPKISTGIDWSNIVEQVFEKVDGSIELTRQGLTRIDPVVADLSKFVSIPHLRRDSAATNASPSLSRIASGNGNPFERSQSSTSAFGSPNSRKRLPQANESTFNSNLQMFLASNRLKTFPSAFFELQNLVVLTIRDNGLQELPPAIGQLVNLRELNVSQNELRSLPAEIQKLRLDSFRYFPNPFDEPGEKDSVSLRLSLTSLARSTGAEQSRVPAETPSMGPPTAPARSQSHSRLASGASFAMARLVSTPAMASCEVKDASSKVFIARSLSQEYLTPPRLPSLMETCTRVLLEPEEEGAFGSSSKILLEDFESGCLINLNKSLDASIIRSLEAARRSAVKSWGRIRPQSKEEGTWCSGIEASDVKAGQRTSSSFYKRRRLSEMPTYGDFGEASNEESAEEDHHAETPFISIEEQLDRGDDVMSNPWFNRCPNPKHYNASRDGPLIAESKRNSSTAIPFDWPGQITGGRIFSKASVERLEWVSHVAGVAVTQVHLEEVASMQDTDLPMLAKDCKLIPLRWRGCGPDCLHFLESPHVSLE